MKKTVLFIVFLSFGFCFAQETSELIDTYEDYSDLSREQMYVHLNKSTYITGEMLGFNAYVFLKDIKEPSINTANLYCQILDKNNTVIAEKLLMANQGVARGEFMIDSTYSSGEYTFKSYTNWSKNFRDEHNYFLEHFRVINPNETTDDKRIKDSKKIDVQILPESGHLLSGVENSIGVIAKDEFGYGIANLDVQIVDEKGNAITSTTLNKFGIGKFLLHPNDGESYRLVYNYNQGKETVMLPKAESKGVLLSILPNRNHESIILSLKTNDLSFPDLGNRNYKLLIHNGSNANELSFGFNGLKEFSTPIDAASLLTGINIFTLFNDNDEPIAERLYFNYNGLPISKISNAESSPIRKDSLRISLSLASIDTQRLQNLSISVLPSETKSYQHHQNIISSIYLQPYLKSAVEQATYYFTDISDKKKYELDNLLLTQGWSSYDWTTIFNAPPEPVYNFEVGINYIINVNNAKRKELMIYPNANTKSELLTLDENQKSFEKRGFFPLVGEKLRIGEISSNGNLGKSDVVLQFEPSKIIGFDTKYQPKTVLKANQYSDGEPSEFEFNAVEVLDEVKIYAKKEYTKIEKLQNRSFGKITDFGEKERQFYKTFAQFISQYGFVVEETPDVDVNGDYSRFRIWGMSPTSLRDMKTNVPLIYLDNALLVDLDILHKYSMEFIDYVEVNKSGIGEGVRGGQGVIRIFTDPNKQFKQKPKTSFTEYDIPLTYSKPERFYVPKYKSYDSKFFKAYGVMDWIPNAKLDANGTFSFELLQTNTDLTLFIEGVVNGNQLISQRIPIHN